ncbi:MAG TPA: c-type cytochrome [Candidatus Sulfomarinibacteraceae bacterium]|nr:c-type cytochrome [Candidatus Sulfomarinibacteraceae bacterium]
MKVMIRFWPVVLAAPVVLTVVWAANAQVAGAPVGRDLAANCFQCHGTQGRAVEGMPSIAGEDAASTYGSMLEYKDKEETDDIMVPIARAYTDQQLWELSLYLASLPEHPAEPDDSGDEVSGGSNGTGGGA